MWNDKNIVFLISMPRSGSTLLQRILATHTDIATTSESWLLLPQLYALKEGSAFSEYSHITSSRAINDFCECMPDKADGYLKTIKSALVNCYRSVADDETKFFLEKTPRNNLVLNEIVAMFPESKYILLWRNPAAIVASMINSFSNGKWNIYRHEIDLFKGLENMLDADTLNIKYRHDIKYEDLVTAPSKIMDELCHFLGLSSVPLNFSILNNYPLQGRMGDKSGVHEYQHISASSLDKWKLSFSNPLRKRWLIKYLEYIGSEDLSRMGYDKDELMRSISSIEFGSQHLLSDMLRMTYGALDARFQISLICKLHNQNKRKYVLQ